MDLPEIQDHPDRFRFLIPSSRQVKIEDPAVMEGVVDIAVAVMAIMAVTVPVTDLRPDLLVVR